MTFTGIEQAVKTQWSVVLKTKTKQKNISSTVNDKLNSAVKLLLTIFNVTHNVNTITYSHARGRLHIVFKCFYVTTQLKLQSSVW